MADRLADEASVRSTHDAQQQLLHLQREQLRASLQLNSTVQQSIQRRAYIALEQKQRHERLAEQQAISQADLNAATVHHESVLQDLRDAGMDIQSTGGETADVGDLVRTVIVDSTVVAQAPRLAAHIPGMRECIAKALQVAPDQVNVKAKTAERLGPVGQGLAMEARAVALIYKA